MSEVKSLLFLRILAINPKAVITEVFTVMIPLIGKDHTQQKLLPSITELFSDENADVRIGVARAAAKFIQVTGPESFSSLGAHLKNAIQDNKWRVRVAVLEGVIDLALFFQVLNTCIPRVLTTLPERRTDGQIH